MSLIGSVRAGAWLTLLILSVEPPATAPPFALAYMAGGRVCLREPAADKPRYLTEVLRYGVDRPLVWSPDGSKLLYWSHSEMGWDLWVTDPDGKNQTNLTNTKTGGCRSGAWSPDGKRIAFMRDDPPGLYVMDADGKNQKILSSKGHRDEPPVWSPDGTRLIFIDLRTDAGVALDLYRIDADGRNERRLATGASNPCWLADGTGILFVSLRQGEPGLCKIDADGVRRTMLSKEPVVTLCRAPDSKRLAFVVGEDNETSHLWVMDLGSFQARELTRLEGNGKDLNWSPDGRWLAFEAGPWKQEEIFVLNLTGNQKRKLFAGVAHGPVWQPRP